LTPSTVLSVHEVRVDSWMLGGAPHLGGKVRVQGPVTVMSLVSVTGVAARIGPGAALRKTTKTDSRSARSSGTVVKLVSGP